MKNNLSAIDVGQYIIDCFHKEKKSITTLKLQKLVYYSQAWSMVWDDSYLFEEDFEAWINGPVVVSLFHALQGYYYCPQNIPNANSNQLTNEQKETIQAVLRSYGDLTSSELVQLTHKEDPWKNARKDLSSTTPSNNIIKKQDIADYYISIYDKEN